MIIAVDIDDTITNGERFWCDDVTPDEEVLEKMNELYKQGHKIIYHTARHPDYYGQTYAWLVKHGAYFTALEMGKLTADVYVDDKALHVDDVDRLLDNPDYK